MSLCRDEVMEKEGYQGQVHEWMEGSQVQVMGLRTSVLYRINVPSRPSTECLLYIMFSEPCQNQEHSANHTDSSASFKNILRDARLS